MLNRTCMVIRAFAILSVASLSTSAAVLRVGPSRTYTALQQVVALINAGDTVLVDGDQTYTGGVTFTRRAERNRPIVIRGVRVNGRRPVISGGTNTVTFMSASPYASGADHYVFESFEIVGGTFRGIYHQADNLTVRDVLVRDCPAHGILGGDVGAGSCLLEFVEIYGCGNGSSQHQIYMSTDQVNRPGSVFRMQHCFIHDGKGGNNVKSRAERNEIYYNWIEGAFYHELELIGPDPDGVASGWRTDLKREDSDVVGNVLRKTRSSKSNNDTNFSVTRIGGDATGWTHGRYRFVNNTIIAGSGAIFRCFDTLETLEAYNNVFYRMSGAPNMMRTAEANWTTGSPVIAGANNWIGAGAQNVPSQWTGTITGTNPGFANASTADFRPGSLSSPLVNAATANVARGDTFAFPRPQFPPTSQPPVRTVALFSDTRHAAGALDIGAFEHSPASIARKEVAKMRSVSAAPATSCDISGRLVTAQYSPGTFVSADGSLKRSSTDTASLRFNLR